MQQIDMKVTETCN